MFCICACISGDRLIELGDARLELIDGIVQRLHLAGNGVELAAGPFRLRIELLLQRIHRGGHLVGVVGGLLHQVLQHAEACVERRLKTLHHVEQLLHLRLQLDDLFGGRVGRSRRGGENESQGGGGEERGCGGL